MSRVVAVACALLVSGCAGTWQETTRATLSGASQTAGGAVGVSYKACRTVLEECKAKKQNPCARLMACQQIRRVVVMGAQKVQMLVLNGYAAVAIGDNPTAQQFVLEVLGIVKIINRAMGALK